MNKHSRTPLNERQRKVLNMLWDGFEGKLTAAKWAKINRCPIETAEQDIASLASNGMLCRLSGNEGSEAYTLAEE